MPGFRIQRWWARGYAADNAEGRRCCTISTTSLKSVSAGCTSTTRAIGCPFGKLPLRLGACGEFSDYGAEGIGWSSRWSRLDRRPPPRGMHTNVLRKRLDRPNEAPCCARAKPRYLQSIICCAGRCRLANHRCWSSISRFSRNPDPDVGRKRTAGGSRGNHGAVACIALDKASCRKPARPSS